MNRIEYYGNMKILESVIFKKMIDNKSTSICSDSLNDAFNFLKVEKKDLQNEMRVNIYDENISFINEESLIEEISSIKNIFENETGLMKPNHIALEIIKKVYINNSRPANYKDFYSDHRLQLRNLLFLGKISLVSKGFIPDENKEYQNIIDEKISNYKQKNCAELKRILDQIQ
jgi:hypothetical protein